MVRAPRIRFRIDFAENLNLGPGKIALLEAIGNHGSLSTAAASLGLSYRRAWLLLDSLNKTFDKPVTHSNAGGKNGGKSSITDFGRLLVKQYRSLENKITRIGGGHLKEILPHLASESAADTSVHRRTLSIAARSASIKKSRTVRRLLPKSK
jgi:molybdate transport system regulatory protein